MFAMAARRLGYRVHTLAPEHDTPTGQIADVEIVASYDDLDRDPRVRARRRRRHLRVRERAGGGGRGGRGARDRPSQRPRARRSRSTASARRRFCATRGLPVTPFATVRTADDLARRRRGASACPPCSRPPRFGYDGKGQVGDRPRHRRRSTAWADARTPRGDARSVHRSRARDLGDRRRAASTGRSSLFGRSTTPIAITSSTCRSRRPTCRRRSPREAIDVTRAVLEALDYVGVLCVEFFVTRDGRLLDQRAGAAAAQLRSPDVRRLPHEPVRAAGARDLRVSARVARAAAAGGDGQSARRSVGRRRAGLGGGARAARRQAASVRQDRRRGPAARWDTSRRSRQTTEDARERVLAARDAALHAQRLSRKSSNRRQS